MAAAARLPHLRPPLQSKMSPVYDSLVSCYDTTQNADIVLFVPANEKYLNAVVDCVFGGGLVRHEARITFLCATFADIDRERAATILKSIGKFRSDRPRAHWVRTDSLFAPSAPKSSATRSSTSVTLSQKQLALVKRRSESKGVTKGFQQSRLAHQQVLDQFAAVNCLTGTKSGTDRQRRLWNALGKSVVADAAPGRSLATMAGHTKATKVGKQMLAKRFGSLYADSFKLRVKAGRSQLRDPVTGKHYYGDTIVWISGAKSAADSGGSTIETRVADSLQKARIQSPFSQFTRADRTLRGKQISSVAGRVCFDSEDAAQQACRALKSDLSSADLHIGLCRPFQAVSLEVLNLEFIITKLLSEGQYADVPDGKLVLSAFLYMDAVDSVTNVFIRLNAALNLRVFDKGCSAVQKFGQWNGGENLVPQYAKYFISPLIDMLNRDFVCADRPNLVISIDFDAEGADHCGFGKLACRRISSNPDRCPFTSNLISHFSRVAHNQTPSFWVVNQVDAYFKHIHNLSVKWEEFMKLNPTKKDWTMSELKRQIAVERLKGLNVTGVPPLAKAGVCGGSIDFHKTRSFMVVPIGHCVWHVQILSLRSASLVLMKNHPNARSEVTQFLGASTRNAKTGHINANVQQTNEFVYRFHDSISPLLPDICVSEGVPLLASNVFRVLNLFNQHLNLPTATTPARILGSHCGGRALWIINFVLAKYNTTLHGEMESLYMSGVSSIIPAFEDFLYFERRYLDKQFSMWQLNEMPFERAHQLHHTMFTDQQRNAGRVDGSTEFALMSELRSELAPSVKHKSVHNAIQIVPFAAYVWHRCTLGERALAWAFRALVFSTTQHDELCDLIFLAFEDKPLYLSDSEPRAAVGGAGGAASASTSLSARNSTASTSGTDAAAASLHSSAASAHLSAHRRRQMSPLGQSYFLFCSGAAPGTQGPDEIDRVTGCVRAAPQLSPTAPPPVVICSCQQDVFQALSLSPVTNTTYINVRFVVAVQRLWRRILNRRLRRCTISHHLSASSLQEQLDVVRKNPLVWYPLARQGINLRMNMDLIRRECKKGNKTAKLPYHDRISWKSAHARLVRVVNKQYAIARPVVKRSSESFAAAAFRAEAQGPLLLPPLHLIFPALVELLFANLDCDLPSEHVSAFFTTHVCAAVLEENGGWTRFSGLRRGSLQLVSIKAARDDDDDNEEDIYWQNPTPGTANPAAPDASTSSSSSSSSSAAAPVSAAPTAKKRKAAAAKPAKQLVCDACKAEFAQRRQFNKHINQKQCPVLHATVLAAAAATLAAAKNAVGKRKRLNAPVKSVGGVPSEVAAGVRQKVANRAATAPATQAATAPATHAAPSSSSSLSLSSSSSAAASAL